MSVLDWDNGRQSERSPMFNQGLNHRMSEDGVIGPRGDQTSMHRYSVENFNSSSAFFAQALDNIEAIQARFFELPPSGEYQPLGGGG